MALTDNLVSYWKLDESSGVRADSHGSNNLTDNNTVGVAAGKINNAAQFVAANSEYLSHSSNSDLTTGDIDFTLQAWVYLDTKTVLRPFVAKYEFGAEKEFVLHYNVVDDYFSLLVRDTLGNTGFVNATNLGSPSTGTWYCIHAWHDSVNDQLGIAVNAGTANLNSHTDGVSTSTTAEWQLGHIVGGDATYMDGRIDEVGFWKRVLTSGERSQLYNSGNGLAYPFNGSNTYNETVQDGALVAGSGGVQATYWLSLTGGSLGGGAAVTNNPLPSASGVLVSGLYSQLIRG
jgi:hypothetical protein